jgi:hypothetical protein
VGNGTPFPKPLSPRALSSSVVTPDNKLIVYGGTGYWEPYYGVSQVSPLHDLAILDLDTQQWVHYENVSGTSTPGAAAGKPLEKYC